MRFLATDFSLMGPKGVWWFLEKPEVRNS